MTQKAPGKNQPNAYNLLPNQISIHYELVSFSGQVNYIQERIILLK